MGAIGGHSSAGNEPFSTPLARLLNFNVTAHIFLICVVNSPVISSKACMGVYRRVLTCKSSITYLSAFVLIADEIQSGYKYKPKSSQKPLETSSTGKRKAPRKRRFTNGL